MNKKKLYKEIVDDLLKSSNLRKFRYGRYGDYLGILPDAFRVYFVKSDEFPFVLNMITDESILDLTSLMEGNPLGSRVEKGDRTGIEKTETVQLKKRTSVLIKSESYDVSVNKDFLKYFDGNEEYTLEGITGKVKIYESGELVAMVLPLLRLKNK